MNLTSHFTHQFEYNTWANREVCQSVLVFQSITRTTEPPARVQEVLAHIVAAEWLWLGRMGIADTQMAVWPALTPAECQTHFDELARTWESYTTSLDENELARMVDYTNSKGEQWSNSVVDILTHLLLHSSYHRGQIATLLGQNGHKAAYTDFIEYVRRGLGAK